jgi:8-oxo-dGTP diphosphatase
MNKLSPKEFYKSLTKIPCAAGAVIRDKTGKFLIVKPTYKEHWNLPGGMTDLHENPREAAIREVREEIGIEISKVRLFCVDFAKDDPFDRFLFIFDGGEFSNETIDQIRVDSVEIGEYKFVNECDFLLLLSTKTSTRMKNSLEALKNNGFIYLENQQPV